jgi:hypothetical protein
MTDTINETPALSFQPHGRQGSGYLRWSAAQATKLAPSGHGETSTATTATARDLRLDFFRGSALFLIFIDHIPGNVLSYFTVQSLGFSDAAEIFIFISGYTAAMVFGRALLRQGAWIAAAKVFHRVWQLYVAHIFVFLIFTALVSYNVLTFGKSAFGKELHVAKFFTEPYIAVIRMLELRFQPNFLDILPLYIVLLAGFPLILLLLRRHALTALIPSFAIYVAAQTFGLSLHGYPGNHAWLFNPLAWQFLFVIGAACGYVRDDRHPIMPPPPGWLIGPAAMIVAAAAAIKLSWTFHNVSDAVPALLIEQLWPMDKSDLAPIRLLHFLALAIVAVRYVAADAPFLRWRVTEPIIRCGQYSLQIFCLGILLSVISHFVLNEWNDSLMAQLAVNMAGFVLMIGTAALLGWYRAIDRTTAFAQLPA